MRRRGGIFHLKWPRYKHEENSDRGDWEAVETGCWGSDHDWMKTRISGVTWNNHWADPWRRDGFEDPAGEFHRGDRFEDMTDEEVRRQVAYTNGHAFHIRTADEGIIHAAKVGLRCVYGEAKPGGVRWTRADFRARKRTAKAHKIGLVVMTMDSHPGWRRTLWLARMAGCRTRRLRMHGKTG